MAVHPSSHRPKKKKIASRAERLARIKRGVAADPKRFKGTRAPEVLAGIPLEVSPAAAKAAKAKRAKKRKKK